VKEERKRAEVRENDETPAGMSETAQWQAVAGIARNNVKKTLDYVWFYFISGPH
jgi:hypothetical protein